MARLSRLVVVTASPFRGYGVLGEEVRGLTPREARERIALGVVRLLLVVGVFVSFTSTGRLSPVDTLLAAGSFVWIPLVQALGVFAGKSAARSDMKIERWLALYFDGHGVWFLALLAIVAALLFAPSSASAVFVVGPVAVLFALVWGIVTTFAMFRRGADLGAGRAALATLVFCVVTIGAVLGYYVLAGQLLPILPLPGGPT